MSVPGFNQEKCAQRNRISAARFGVDAVPLRFRGSAPAALQDDFLSLKSAGTMPPTPEDALALINQRLPEGAAALALDEVYLQFHEAANSNFVSCRSVYLDESTLRNIAQGGEDGVSFMNAHRTGGLSTPSELPFGQTFCGFYEEGFDAQGNAARRATLGVYLLRGAKPNGDNGPSTDDLDRGFRAGTVKDVSVGLSGGEEMCNVCGYGLDARGVDENGNSYAMCPHVPGTHRGMSPDQVESQKQRDPRNSTGVATYSLCNAHLNELSAVYDGAVPGAGIRKVMSLSKNGAGATSLERDDVHRMLREAYEYYGALLPFDLADIVEIKPALKNAPPGGNMSLLQKIATKLGIDTEETIEPEVEIVEVPAASSEPTKIETPATVEPSGADAPASGEDLAVNAHDLQVRLDAANVALAAAKAGQLQHAREQFAVSLQNKLPPAARENFTKLFAQLQANGATTELEAAVAALPQHALLTGVPADLNATDKDLQEVQPPRSAEEKMAEAAYQSGREFGEATNPKTKAAK